ncbi:MAG: ABC transporter permease subunit [Bacillota bacterium]|nr:ABC transporter permease subunit [Bacillota bacterium]NLL26255.1 ABC transporter permease subunit [Erysipelotrichia bacterium]
MSKVFSRTLETTLKKISIIVSALVGALVGAIIISAGKNSQGMSVYHVLLENNLILQHLLIFFVINGFLLMILTISNASGLVASEIHEGTFKLLAAKPNSRSQILLGKILGTIAGLTILLLVSLLSYFSTIVIAHRIDGNVIREMISFFPAYFLYGVFVILLFTGVATLLSCVFKRKLTAMLPLLVVVVVALGFFPIQRFMASIRGTSIVTAIKYIDLNYHFALVFKFFVEMIETIKPDEVLAYLMNLFSVRMLDSDVTRIEWGGKILSANDSLSVLPVILFYGAITVVSYISSFAIIEKKDI